MCFRYVITLFITASVIFSAPSDSGVSPVADNRTDASQTISTNISYDPVNSGDLIYVFVADYPSITRSYRISQTGEISIPALKEVLNVAGLTPSELEKKVSRVLLDAKLLVSPVVSVAVLEYRSRAVEVSGAVRHPVTIQALGNMRLLDALAQSDGLDNDAGSEILVLSESPGGGVDHPEVRIPIKALLDGSNPQLNIFLHGGEQIRVPRAGKLYVVGNVRTAGAFPFTDADGISVLKALGLCQGLLPYSSEDAIVYRLTPGSNQRTEITVHVKDILKHRSADVLLQENDIFYVGDRSGRRLAVSVLERLTGVAAAAPTAAIWRAIP